MTTSERRKKIKQEAQDAIMIAIGNACYAVSDNDDYSASQKDNICDEIAIQMKRVEKLFGYSAGTWGV